MPSDTMKLYQEWKTAADGLRRAIETEGRVVGDDERDSLADEVDKKWKAFREARKVESEARRLRPREI